MVLSPSRIELYASHSPLGEIELALALRSAIRIDSPADPYGPPKMRASSPTRPTLAGL